ncbi:MAG: response regulator [Chloroflexota bacterium]|nr:response regulator [Chloroflexota bacterium]
MNHIQDEPVDILLVEDNIGDVRLTQEAFKEARFNYNLHIARDGIEALSYLRKQGKYKDAIRPDIVLLDLNMPKKDGRQVLIEIKADDTLKRLPVIVLTTSETTEDIIRSYNLHANCYITKPLKINHFIGVIQTIDEFWLKIARLPQE